MGAMLNSAAIGIWVDSHMMGEDAKYESLAIMQKIFGYG
jgi:hypothetical protein